MRLVATGTGALPGVQLQGAGAAILKNNDIVGALTDPIGNIGNIVFSSWSFDYFTGKQEMVTTISMPARAADSSFVNGTKYAQGYSTGNILSGNSEYLIGNHWSGAIPAIIAHVPSLKRTLSSTSLFANGDSARILTIVPTASEIWLSESWYTSSTSLPAL